MANEYVRKQYVGGAAQTVLSSGITDIQTSLSLASVAGWPADGATPFVITIDPDLPAEETLLCTKVGTALTAVERGYDGTTAVAHNANAVVIHSFDAHTADQTNRLANLLSTKGEMFASDGSNPVAVPGPIGPGDDGKLMTALDAAGAGWSLLSPANVVVQSGPPNVSTTVYRLWRDTDQNTLRVSDGAEWLFDVPMLTYADKSARAAALTSPVAGQVTLLGTGIIEYYDGTKWRTVGLPEFADVTARDAYYSAPYDGARALTLNDHKEYQYRQDEWILRNFKVTVSATQPLSPHDGDHWFQPI